MELLIQLVEVLAWPATVLIAIAMLRKPLAALIPLVHKIKYKDLEIEFKRRLEALEQQTPKPVGRAKTTDAAPIPVEAAEESKPSSSSRDIILDAWLSLEATAISTVQHFKLYPLRRRLDVNSQ